MNVLKEDLEIAHKKFDEVEPRDLFYRAATELVVLALSDETRLSLAEAIAVLLQTWNISYYRFIKLDKKKHISDIEERLIRFKQPAEDFRKRTIMSFCDEDHGRVRDLFSNFEKILGPVGTAKCLHLLAPRFFPLWDRSIAKGYNLALQKDGRNVDRYCKFMTYTKEQYKSLKKKDVDKVMGIEILKALDEYNYCTYTLPEKEKERANRQRKKEEKLRLRVSSRSA